MAARFWVGGTGTWDAADTTHWSATTGGAGGASVPGVADNVTFDASSGGGTVTVNTNPSIVNFTMGAFTGTVDFSANDNNITISQVCSLSGTGLRVLNMGDGTWSLTSNNGTVWDCTTSTNLTLNANGSTILASSNPLFSRSMALGTGLSYNIISVANTVAKPWAMGFSGAGTITIATLLVSTPMNIGFSSTATYNITNPLTLAGTAHDNAHAITAGNGVTPTVGLAGGSTLSWCSFAGITFTGSPVANNSFDMKGNSGITINAPSGGGGGSVARVIG